MSVSTLVVGELQLMRERLFAWMSSDGGLVASMVPPTQRNAWDDSACRSWVQALVAQALAGNEEAQMRVLTREAAAALRRQAHACGEVVVTDAKSAMICADLVGHMLAELKTVWDLLETSSELNLLTQRRYVAARVELLTRYVLCTLNVSFSAVTDDLNLETVSILGVVEAVVESNMVIPNDIESRPAGLRLALAERATEMVKMFDEELRKVSDAKGASMRFSFLEALSDRFSMALVGESALSFLDDAEVDDCWLVHMLQLERDVVDGQLVRASAGSSDSAGEADLQGWARKGGAGGGKGKSPSGDQEKVEEARKTDPSSSDDEEGEAEEEKEKMEPGDAEDATEHAEPARRRPPRRTRRLSQSQRRDECEDEGTPAAQSRRERLRRSPRNQSPSDDSSDKDANFSPSQVEGDEDLSESLADSEEDSDGTAVDREDGEYRTQRRQAVFVSTDAGGQRQLRSAQKTRNSGSAPRKTWNSARKLVVDTQAMLDMYDTSEASYEGADTDNFDAVVRTDDEEHEGGNNDSEVDDDDAMSPRAVRVRRRESRDAARPSGRLTRQMPSETQDILDRYNGVRRTRRQRSSGGGKVAVKEKRNVKRARSKPPLSNRPRRNRDNRGGGVDMNFFLDSLKESSSEAEMVVGWKAQARKQLQGRQRKVPIAKIDASLPPRPARRDASRHRLSTRRPGRSKMKPPDALAGRTMRRSQNAEPTRLGKRTFLEISDDSDDDDDDDKDVVTGAGETRDLRGRRRIEPGPNTAHRVKSRRSPEGVGARVSPRRAGLPAAHDNVLGFTPREDVKLVALLQQYGRGSWHKVLTAGHFLPHRTKADLRARAEELDRELRRN
jgi:hypothetical protein